MASAFLDNGIVLAYCITVHEFHPECDEYIEQSEADLYITDEIEFIYGKKKDEIIRELSTDILEHQADIKRGDFPDELGPTDLKDVSKMIHRGYDARRFLLNWYDREVDQFIQKRQLTERLRNLAEDIESRAQNRKSEFDNHVNHWERDDGDDYPEVQKDLQEVKEDKEEDMWVCIDAHDLAANTCGRTVLATTDINDFVRDGREKLILEATEIDEIDPVVRGSV